MEQEEKNPITPAENAFPAAPEAEKSDLSMLVGTLGFLVILIGLGWYVFGGGKASDVSTLTTPPAETGGALSAVSATSTEDAAAVALSTQGTSDDPKAIEADINATDLNSLGDINKI